MFRQGAADGFDVFEGDIVCHFGGKAGFVGVGPFLYYSGESCGEGRCQTPKVQAGPDRLWPRQKERVHAIGR